jgi:alkanesulfonate monooxygenase SsuD/methylene tetrahydromethanopterin reductase-like flavin-dependent oxidoreductase (luciferase family)
MMTGCVYGKDDAEVQRNTSAHRESIADLRKHGRVVGTASEVVDQLGRLAEAGVQRVMLQWLDLDDLDGLEALARDVLPQFKT